MDYCENVHYGLEMQDNGLLQERALWFREARQWITMKTCTMVQRSKTMDYCENVHYGSEKQDNGLLQERALWFREARQWITARTHYWSDQPENHSLLATCILLLDSFRMVLLQQ